MEKGHITNRRISALALLGVITLLLISTQTQSFAGLRNWWPQQSTGKKLGYIGILCAVTGIIAGTVYSRWKNQQKLTNNLFDGINNWDNKKVLAALAQGANVNGRNRDGQLPLAEASRKGAYEIVESLLAKKADVSGVDGKGRTALVWAAGSRAPDRTRHHIVTQLVEAEANVNAADNYGYTPLLAAAQANPTASRTIRYLLNADANPLATTREGRDALSFLPKDHAGTAESRATVEAAIRIGGRPGIAGHAGIE